jgi:Pyridine nucleotide-disulphide oxidoreductase, dimerisation domain
MLIHINAAAHGRVVNICPSANWFIAVSLSAERGRRGRGHLQRDHPILEVAKTATYSRAYDESNGFITLLSDGERLAGAYALGREAGEWLQQATLAIRARVPLEVLRDTIQPFPTFSEIYIAIAALKALHGQITTARHPVGAATLAR